MFFVLDSGKTSLAATVGIDSDFPYVKIVSGFLFSLNFQVLTLLLYVSYFQSIIPCRFLQNQ